MTGPSPILILVRDLSGVCLAHLSDVSRAFVLNDYAPRTFCATLPCNTLWFVSLLTCAMQIMYIVSQFVFGYGVGGEYPMAAGSAAERAETGGIQKARFRGREVVLTFSMQVSHQLQMQWKLPTPGRPLFSSLIRTLG